jgi:hypothetical protein
MRISYLWGRILYTFHSLIVHNFAILFHFWAKLFPFDLKLKPSKGKKTAKTSIQWDRIIQSMCYRDVVIISQFLWTCYIDMIGFFEFLIPWLQVSFFVFFFFSNFVVFVCFLNPVGNIFNMELHPPINPYLRSQLESFECWPVFLSTTHCCYRNFRSAASFCFFVILKLGFILWVTPRITPIMIINYHF